MQLRLGGWGWGGGGLHQPHLCLCEPYCLSATQFSVCFSPSSFHPSSRQFHPLAAAPSGRCASGVLKRSFGLVSDRVVLGICGFNLHKRFHAVSFPFHCVLHTLCKDPCLCSLSIQCFLLAAPECSVVRTPLIFPPSPSIVDTRGAAQRSRSVKNIRPLTDPCGNCPRGACLVTGHPRA